MPPMPHNDPLPYRLLVVDDEQPIRDLLGELLVEEGMCPALVADLPGALAALERERFDLILADPLADFSADHPVDHWSTLEALQARARTTPIVIFSAHAAGLFPNLQARGFAGFIAKPFDLDTLAQTLRVCIESAPHARQHADSSLAST